MLGTTLVSIFDEVRVVVLDEVGSSVVDDFVAGVGDEFGVVVLDEVWSSVIDDFVAGVGDEIGVDGWSVVSPRDTEVEDGSIQRHSRVGA